MCPYVTSTGSENADKASTLILKFRRTTLPFRIDVFSWLGSRSSNTAESAVLIYGSKKEFSIFSIQEKCAKQAYGTLWAAARRLAAFSLALRYDLQRVVLSRLYEHYASKSKHCIILDSYIIWSPIPKWKTTGLPHGPPLICACMQAAVARSSLRGATLSCRASHAK